MNLKVRRGLAGILLSMIILSTPAVAQQARETFGKNRIQYKEFDWQYLSGENFDIYYYDAQKEIASDALQYLEKEFDRITDLIDYPPYYKTKVFLYKSLADLRQSNVGLNHTVFNVGGETEFIKPYVEVANMGTIHEFKEELIGQVSDLLVREMMFGGNLKDVFQSSILMNLPEWFVDGASMYVAKGWSPEMDDFIREFMASKRSKKISRLTGREAALAGQSVWNFIAEKYGKSNVSNILNYTRVTRNEEKSILLTLGVPYKQLMLEWQKYYVDMNKVVNSSYVAAADSSRFNSFQNKTTNYTTVKISPDGNYIAYAENDRGHFSVKVRSLRNGKERTILTDGSKVIKQRVDYRLPLLAWSDASTLGVIGLKNGQYVFWLYDLTTRTKILRELDKFNNVRSLNFSGNGRLVILSADFEGQNDLFLLSSKKDRVRRLTTDLYDDLDPSFIPGTNKIVFSSNRSSDSLHTSRKYDFQKLTNHFNLFTYDLDSLGSELKRVTNTLSKDFAPLAQDENNFYYLSDQRGIVNLFRFNKSTGIYTQITNFNKEVKDYDLNFGTHTLVFVNTKKGHQNIYVNKDFNLNAQVFTPATRRKELQQARVIFEKKKIEENKNMSIKDLLNSRLKQNQVPDSAKRTPTAEVTKQDTVEVEVIGTTKKSNDIVNTDNYQFEDDAVKKEQPAETFISRYTKTNDKRRISGPFPYEPKFSANNVVTSLVIDPLRGFGVLLETQMNDMLENNRFYGGIMTTTNLKSGTAYLEYQYLPKLIDFNARFDRKGVQWETDSLNLFHYELNRLEVGASLPLSDRLRISAKPFASYTRTIDYTAYDVKGSATKKRFAPPVTHYYAGFKAELVYDNSVSSGLNLIEGTRGKISFTNYQGIGNSSLGFNQVSAELRHYQKIYKEIVFAVRGFAGTFFGKSPKLYLLGGMDNWIARKTNFSGETYTREQNPLGGTPNEDILFAEYTTSLRGFNYATIFGNSALLLNAELRIPLIKVLSSAPVSSPFFKNMMFVGFYDIGTSWSGTPPFTNEEASVGDVVMNNPPFYAKVKKYINPWLYSYGAGVRTVVLGYYLKFDMAWPVENYKVGSPRPLVTIGFDF